MITDICVREVTQDFQYVPCRTPIKFGAQVMSGSTLCTTRVTVENGGGRTAEGVGQILLADFWAFPCGTVSHNKRDAAMRRSAEKVGKFVVENSRSPAHPMDIFLSAVDEFDSIARSVTEEMRLDAALPHLAVTVAASPLDAAIHDAHGKVNGVNCWTAYTRDFMKRDLAHYLNDPAYRGRWPGDFLRSASKGRIPIFHLVGGLDKLLEAETGPDDPQDGLPVSLEAWIRQDGLKALKVKLRGNDVEWDVNRTVDVYKVAEDPHVVLSADMNEVCESPEYISQYIERLEAACAPAARQLLYIEQPTSRNVFESSHDWHAVGRVKPIVLDEGLESVAHMREALSQGWSGVALKTCKGQSLDLLCHSIADKEGIFVTLQDLCNTGYALLHSMAWGAWSDSIRHVEYNSRQYMPCVSPEIRAAHPRAFIVDEGTVSAESLVGDGLGY